jgi:phosphoribosylaminoimidazole-succinocarboxamide synthase
MAAKGIPTQYISCDPSQDTMVVKQGVYFGKGLECICRFKAVGSFMRRFGSIAKEGQDLDALVEFTLKDDERQDPPATKDILVALGVVTEQEYETLKKLTRDISNLIKDELAAKGLELYDIKLEFGRHGDEIILIDEVSAGNMRVYKDGKSVAPIELTKLVLA